MDSCHSTDLFPTTNRSRLWIIRGLSAFRDSYEPIHGHLCLPICAFGIITNIVHILVLTSKSMRTSAVNIILSAIAICDAGTMLSYLIYLIHFVLSPQDYCANGGSFLSWPWMLFLMIHISVSIALHTCSLWLAVAMAFIRLMTLRQGTLSSKWQKSEIAWKISIMVPVTVLLLCIPTIASHEIREFHRGAWHSMCRTNVSRAKYMNDSAYAVYTIGISQLALTEDCGMYKANLWLTGVMFKVIPCCLLIVLSISLLIRISAAEKNRRRLLGSGAKAAKAKGGMKSTVSAAAAGREHMNLTLSSFSSNSFFSNNNNNNNNNNRKQSSHHHSKYSLSSRNDSSIAGDGKQQQRKKHRKSSADHTTIMLITILFVFLLTEFPQGVIAILNAMFLRDVTLYVYQSLDDFMDLLSLVNACVNFILYCVMSTRYRQSFWRVILPRHAYVRLFLRGSERSNAGGSSHRGFRQMLGGLGSRPSATFFLDGMSTTFAGGGIPTMSERTTAADIGGGSSSSPRNSYFINGGLMIDSVDSAIQSPSSILLSDGCEGRRPDQFFTGHLTVNHNNNNNRKHFHRGGQTSSARPSSTSTTMTSLTTIADSTIAAGWRGSSSLSSFDLSAAAATATAAEAACPSTNQREKISTGCVASLGQNDGKIMYRKTSRKKCRLPNFKRFRTSNCFQDSTVGGKTGAASSSIDRQCLPEIIVGPYCNSNNIAERRSAAEHRI